MSKSRIFDGEPPGGIAIRPNQTDEVTPLEDVNESINETKHRILKPSYFLLSSKEAADWREKCLESLKDDLMKAIYKDMDNNDAR